MLLWGWGMAAGPPQLLCLPVVLGHGCRTTTASMPSCGAGAGPAATCRSTSCSPSRQAGGRAAAAAVVLPPALPAGGCGQAVVLPPALPAGGCGQAVVLPPALPAGGCGQAGAGAGACLCGKQGSSAGACPSNAHASARLRRLLLAAGRVWHPVWLGGRRGGSGLGVGARAPRACPGQRRWPREQHGTARTASGTCSGLGRLHDAAGTARTASGTCSGSGGPPAGLLFSGCCFWVRDDAQCVPCRSRRGAWPPSGPLPCGAALPATRTALQIRRQRVPCGGWSSRPRRVPAACDD